MATKKKASTLLWALLLAFGLFAPTSLQASHQTPEIRVGQTLTEQHVRVGQSDIVVPDRLGQFDVTAQNRAWVNYVPWWYDASGSTLAPRRTLYHYTDDAGLDGITSSQKLNPSLKANNPNDVRYGNGQYLSDIVPGAKTNAQLSREFLNIPFQGKKFKNYVEIDVTDLPVKKGRDGVFVVPNETPLDLTGRIINSGSN